VDWVANTITLNVLQGTPSASPGAPAITQNSSRWEISLGYVYINPAASTIASSNVTDERPFAWPAVCNQHSVAIGIANQALTTATETQITLIPQGNSFPLDSYWSLSNWIEKKSLLVTNEDLEIRKLVNDSRKSEHGFFFYWCLESHKLSSILPSVIEAIEYDGISYSSQYV
jgi:hypothetical protein